MPSLRNQRVGCRICNFSIRIKIDYSFHRLSFIFAPSSVLILCFINRAIRAQFHPFLSLTAFFVYSSSAFSSDFLPAVRT